MSTDASGANSLPHMPSWIGSTPKEAADRRHSTVVALPPSASSVAPPELPGPRSTGFSSPAWSPGSEKSATQVSVASAIGYRQLPPSASTRTSEPSAAVPLTVSASGSTSSTVNGMTSVVASGVPASSSAVTVASSGTV